MVKGRGGECRASLEGSEWESNAGEGGQREEGGTVWDRVHHHW